MYSQGKSSMGIKRYKEGYWRVEHSAIFLASTHRQATEICIACRRLWLNTFCTL